jgi:hypothetical protein
MLPVVRETKYAPLPGEGIALQILRRVGKFLAHGFWPSRTLTATQAAGGARWSDLSSPSLNAELEAAILRYRSALRNYEASRIMGIKVSADTLDFEKLSIADALLRSRGINSFISDSKLRDEREKLVRAGENQMPGRPAIPQWLRWAVFKRDKYKCVDCGIFWALSCDHVIPYSKGGATTMENLATRCTWCNSRKGDRLPHAKLARPQLAGLAGLEEAVRLSTGPNGEGGL